MKGFEYAGYEDGVLYPWHNHGLFSCVSTVLWSVADVTRVGLPVTRINNAHGMQWWKNTHGIDTWEHLYRQPEEEAVRVLARHSEPRQWRFSCHGEYHATVRDVGALWLHTLMATYLTPSDRVVERAAYFREQYGIGRNTVVVCYRGTDKHVEETPVPVATYMGVVDRLLEYHGEVLTVLIQTDQTQVRERFVRRYGAERCWWIKELPATRGWEVMHRRGVPDREQFAVDLVAMTVACRSARFLITHTGNVGFFLAVPRILGGQSVVQLRASSPEVVV